MGFIMLFYYNTEYIQGFATKLGTHGPITLILAILNIIKAAMPLWFIRRSMFALMAEKGHAPLTASRKLTRNYGSEKHTGY